MQNQRQKARGMDQISQACDNYDLTISTKQTEVGPQPAPGKSYSEPTIMVNGHRLQDVDISPTFPEQCKWMMRKLAVLAKPLWFLIEFLQMYGSGIESDLTLI